MAEVITFPGNVVSQAMGRNRKQALAVIVPRLKELLAQTPIKSHAGLLGAEHKFNGLIVQFRPLDGHGIHVLVLIGKDVLSAQKVLSGWLRQGQLDVASWKRGDWQKLLFVPSAVISPDACA